MLTNYLDNLSQKAKEKLQKHRLIQTTRKEFLEKGLSDVQVVDFQKNNEHFVAVLHSADEYFIACRENADQPIYFLTVRNLRIDGIPLNWFFMKMKNRVWSMERDTLKDIFIEHDCFLFTEMDYFFKNIEIKNIYCKGDFSTILGKRLVKNQIYRNPKKNRSMMGDLIIIDRTNDLFTPLNTNIDPKNAEKQMMDILLTEMKKFDMLNALLNLYLLSVHLNLEMSKVKREMVYTFGEKVIILFDMIEKLLEINKKEHIYIPDLCKAVRKKDTENYNFDFIHEFNRDTEEHENAVFLLGGVCQKELKDFKNYTVLTTKVVGESFLRELQN